MTELAEIAIAQFQSLSDDQQDSLAHRFIELIDAELDAIEDDYIEPILYEFTREDGSIDFEKLHELTEDATLDDLFPEQK